MYNFKKKGQLNHVLQGHVIIANKKNKLEKKKKKSKLIHCSHLKKKKDITCHCPSVSQPQHAGLWIFRQDIKSWVLFDKFQKLLLGEGDGMINSCQKQT